MKTNKKIGASLFVASLMAAFFVSVLVGQAAEKAQPSVPPTGETRMVSEADILAAVDVNNVKIVSQEGSNIEVSFDILTDDGKAQPQLRYSISLTKKVNLGSLPVDERVYEEVFSLVEKQVLHKEVEYIAPAYLKGEYALWIRVTNSNGLVVGMGMIEKVTLNGTGEFVEVISSSCFLTVEGEVGKRYDLMQGVDVSIEEKLIGHCEVQNNFKTAMTVTPSLETYWRTIYGKVVTSEKKDVLTLSAGEKKEVSYEITKAKQPQAYDAVLSLQDASGNLASNQVRFHYVLRGASATIQNVRFDKDYYAKGETAKIDFNWTPSADGFYGSRSGSGTELKSINVDVLVQDVAGKNCSVSLNKQLTGEQGLIILEIPIIEECFNPTAKIVLKDGQSKLDESVFAVATVSQKAEENIKEVEAKMVTESGSFGGKKVIWYVFGALPIVVLILFLVRKKKHNNQISSLLLLFSLVTAGMIFFAGNASAHYWGVCANYGGRCNYYSTSISGGGVYDPGATMRTLMEGWAGYCANGGRDMWAGGWGSWMGAKPDSFGILMIATYDGYGARYYDWTVPTTPGNYYVQFCGNGGYIGCHNEDFRVRGCGDGIIEGTEQCDDGNTVSGDDCSATCQNEVCASDAPYTWGGQMPADCSGKACTESALPRNTCFDKCNVFVDNLKCNSATEPAKTPKSCGPCTNKDWVEVAP